MRADGLNRLRDAVAAHEGPARARPLVELGQALAERYWRAGPGTPAGQPVLDEAVEVLGEAYRYFEPDDGVGGQVANLLGWLHGIRHVAHGGPVADREAGITLLGESLRFPQLPPIGRAVGRVVLGQLLLSRVTAGMQGGGPAILQGGGGAGKDAERAVECFRQALDEPAGSAEITQVAGMLLAMAEALRDMTSGSMDLGKMMAAMTTLQNLQRQGAPGGVTPPLFTVADLVTGDPLKRPTAVVDGQPRPTGRRSTEQPPAQQTQAQQPQAQQPQAQQPQAQQPQAQQTQAQQTQAQQAPAQQATAEQPTAGRRPTDQRLTDQRPPPAADSGTPRANGDQPTPGVPRQRPAPPTGEFRTRPRAAARPPAPRAQAGAFRKPLHRLLPAPTTILTWLTADPPPAVHTVDEVLALSASLVAADGATAFDHLPLAAGLYLRGRDQIDGWAAGDLDGAVEALCAAAPALPAAPAAPVIAAALLAVRLDARRPGARARPRLAEHFTDVVAALGTVGADALLFRAGEHRVLLTARGLEEHTGPLPPRVLLCGDAGSEPAVTSHVFTAAQVTTLAKRTRRPIAEDPVFVANPRGDRPAATMDALRLRREFHPRSAGLGETVENVDGAGTAAEVTARLGASLLHLGCGLAPGGALELAAGDILRPPAAAAARTGGVALLPPSPHGAATAEALLASGFVNVIGLAAEVPDRVASLLYFLVHAALVDEGPAPAEAVHRVRARLAGGTLPEFLPADLATAADPAAGQALTCYGC